MKIPSLTLKTIQHHASPQAFARGEQYYETGAVAALSQRGNLLQAAVDGNEAQPYNVTLKFDAGGITTAHCTCAYDDFDGWCKHIVATLLICVHQPETVSFFPSPDELLDRLTPAQTRKVLRSLLEEHPELVFDFEDQVVLATATPLSVATPQKFPKPSRRTPVDPAPFRRQARQVLHDAVQGWESGYDDDPVTENILEIVAKAEEFSQRGDGENAIAILSGITQACVDDWDMVSDYGSEGYELAEELDKVWTEAILTTELTDEQCEHWRSQLLEWQQEWGQDFPISLEALQQGWTYSPLLRVLNGEITEMGAWIGEAPAFADKLALIRLVILERKGLTLPGKYPYDLAVWTSDLAEGFGRSPVALSSRILAFKDKPSLQDYQKIADLAENKWATIRKDLLQTLRWTRRVRQFPGGNKL
jgi:uncharacterized Zn finger protein